MTKNRFARIVMIALPLAMSALLLLHATPSNGQDSKTQGMQVNVDNFTFNPGALTIPVNGTVTWVNKDDIPHVIASNDGLFKSRALDTDQKYSFTFAKAGTYEYYCSVHPKMVGKIVVQ